MIVHSIAAAILLASILLTVFGYALIAYILCGIVIAGSVVVGLNGVDEGGGSGIGAVMLMFYGSIVGIAGLIVTGLTHLILWLL